MSANTPTIYMVDTTGSHLACLSQAVKAWYARDGVSVRVQGRSRDDLFDEKQIQKFADEIRQNAVALFLMPMGGPESIPGSDVFLDAAKGKIIHCQGSVSVQEEMEWAKTFNTNFGQDDEKLRRTYLRLSGLENHLNLLRMVGKELGLTNKEPEPPKEMPCEGIYHPEWDGALDDAAAYLDWCRARIAKIKGAQAAASAPVIGTWFYQSYWLNGDLAAYDAVIAEIEKQGAIPLAIFNLRMQEPESNNMRPNEIVDHFFKRNGTRIVDGILSPMAFSIAKLGPDFENVLSDLNVPIIQMIMTNNTFDVWHDTPQAVSPMDVSVSVAQPEFDGVIVGTIVATRNHVGKDPVLGCSIIRRHPVSDRIERMVRTMNNWITLRRTPASKRKIAILFHHYPPRADRLGAAFGLDSFASVKDMLVALDDDGYVVDHHYQDGDELAHTMLSRLTNDRRYFPPAELAKRAIGKVSYEDALKWHKERHPKVQQEMLEKWGDVPGVTFCHEGELLIGGIFNGNFFIGMQPPRCRMTEEDEPTLQPDGKLMHDPDVPLTHHYAAYYRWLVEDFGAHAVFHIGKHGTLEWLPGKSTGLSEFCYPDVAIRDLPNLYPYIINNPGEGTQAKRRSYACILDHMVPPQTHAGKSEPVVKLEQLLNEAHLAEQEDPTKMPVYMEHVWELLEEAHLDKDLELTKEAAFSDINGTMEAIHEYLDEVAVTAINDGLHIFGSPPNEYRFHETLVHLTRLENGDNPSVWDAIAASWGYEMADLRDNKGDYVKSAEKTKGQILEQLILTLKESFDYAEEHGWSDESLLDLIDEQYNNSPAVLAALKYVRDDVRDRLNRTTEEMLYAVAGAGGQFVPPGPSGCPTRGLADILPTGRNFFSVDPYRIPSPEAWAVGERLGDALVERYKQDTGKVPEQIGMVLWASPTMRTRGDDVAEILYLMGVRPIWDQGAGRVKGLEVIPLEERKFPRLDVTVRASGLLRDTFPNIMDLIDQAVSMVSLLNEPEEHNFLARNVSKDRAELIKAGISEEEADRRARFRLFSDKPGAYGAGVSEMIYSGKWEDVSDLGEIYLHWGGYAYGDQVYGESRHEDFRQRVGRMDLTVKNQDSRESDIFSCDDYNNYHGGLNAAVKAVSGSYARSYSGDSNDPRKPQIRSTEEEGRFVFRTRVLNPKWIEGMKRHGFKGAGDMSKLVDVCFHWDASSDILDDWQYAEMAKTYAFDSEMQEFFRKHNPYALQNITERLLEAIQRGMWKDPGADKDALEALFLEAEGDVEDALITPPALPAQKAS